MNSASPTGNPSLTAAIPTPAPHHPPAVRVSPRRRRASPGAFARVVAAHLSSTPAITVQLARWRQAAQRIPSTGLRETALHALTKQANIEGAALFATLAPPHRRHRTMRALIAYQAAYNYLDALSEQPSPDPVSNAQQLHQALLVAVHPDAPHERYYRHNPEHDDGGYLVTMLDACRQNLAKLPSFPAVAPYVRDASARIIEFQTLTTASQHGPEHPLRAWAQQLTPPHSALHWWETAAGAGSSLAVHALVAAAAHPDTSQARARDTDHAYFPELGALHSLLDSSIDREEDNRQGQPSLIAHYGPGSYAPIRLAWLASGAASGLTALNDAERHRVILAAMASYYLSAPQHAGPDAATLTAALTDALGPRLGICIDLFRAKRLAHTLPGRHYA